MTTRALVFDDVNVVRMRTIEVPAPEPSEVLIEAAYSCISPGTELRCLSGRQPGAPAMPFIPGYAMVGTVVAAGASSPLAVGSRVFCGGTAYASLPCCWGAHVAHAVQRADNVQPLPDGLDLRVAAVSRLAAIAWRGVRLSAPRAGERVVVLGLGPIGMCSARMFHMQGATVLGVDRLAARVQLLTAQGIAAAVLEDSLAATVQRVFPDGVDIVVEATGVPAVAREMVQLARALPWDDRELPATRFVLQASYAGDVAFDYQTLFMGEATLVVPRHHKPHDLRAVLDALTQGRLQLADLVSGVYAPDDAPAVYRQLREAPATLMTALFAWH